LQFQLRDFYQVLGAGGYQLHRELVGDDEALTNTPPNGAQAPLTKHKIPKISKAILLYHANEFAHPSSEDAYTTADASHSGAMELKTNMVTQGNLPASGITTMPDSAMKQDKERISASTLGQIPGGIGAMAAAAAATKKLKTVNDMPASGGIAAMAAAAAATKKLKTVNGMPASGGIAAMAAAAAATKKLKTVNDMPASGGIATMAAAAAATKKLETVNDMPPAGGIAASAAAAKVDTGVDIEAEGTIGASADSRKIGSQNFVSTTAAISPGMGGIAARPAYTVAWKQEESNVEEESQRGEHAPAENGQNLKEELPVDNAASAPTRATWTDAHLQTTERSILVAAMRVGTRQAQASPRDFSSLYCIYLLARRASSLSTPEVDNYLTSEIKETKTMARRLLLRGLAVSNQAASIGIVGWLEYGTSNALERTFSLPLEVLRELASSFAEEDDWDSACDVLGSLCLQCQQRLPSHHPIALCCLMDLAAAYSMAGRSALFERIVSRVSDLMSMYLSQHETLFFEKEQHSAEFESDARRVSFHSKEDIIALLKAFASEFLKQLPRRFLQKIPPYHAARLFNHSMAADSLAVLANCLAAVEDRTPAIKSKSTRNSAVSDATTKGHLYYWSLAYSHYQHALRGWLQIGSLSDPTTAATAYSCARCLRELGMLDHALKLLNTLTSTIKESLIMTEDPEPIDSCRCAQIFVLGLWLTATFTVEQSPDERGRIRALSLLHGASDALRHALRYVDEMDEAARLVFLDVYECIDDEARALFDPMRLVHEDNSPKVAAEDLTRDGWLTAMRRKRWYKAAKSKLDHAVGGSTGVAMPSEKILLI
jgi:hypothetical protein